MGIKKKILKDLTNTCQDVFFFIKAFVFTALLIKTILNLNCFSVCDLYPFKRHALRLRSYFEEGDGSEFRISLRSGRNWCDILTSASMPIMVLFGQIVNESLEINKKQAKSRINECLPKRRHDL